MRAIKGPAIFLARLAGNEARLNGFDSIAANRRLPGIGTRGS
jgi:hypothetical protein